jgi:nitrogenase-stabilizing/protective protein
MSIIADLSRLSSAEDFFRYLDVPYDAATLNVSRLHILKRMGEYLSNAPECSGEEETLERVRGYLLRAYLDFMHSSPLEERVFRVHRQAINRPAAPLVSIAGTEPLES